MGRGRGGFFSKMRRGNRSANEDVAKAIAKVVESSVDQNAVDKCLVDLQAKVDALRDLGVKLPRKRFWNPRRIYYKQDQLEEFLMEIKAKIEILENVVQHMKELQDDNNNKTHVEDKNTELDESVQYVPVHKLDVAALKNIALESDKEPNNTASDTANECQLHVLPKCSSSVQRKNNIIQFFRAIKQKFTKSELKVKDTYVNEEKNTSKSEGHLAEKNRIDTFSAEAAARGDVYDDIDEPAAYPEESLPSELSPEEKNILDHLTFADSFGSMIMTDALRDIEEKKAAEKMQLVKPKSDDDTNMNEAEDEIMFEAYFAKKDPVASFSPAYVN